MTKLSIRDLLKEIMQIHADRKSAEYNECDKTPCWWCENAKRELEEMSKREQTNQHIVKLVEKLDSNYASHAFDCKALKPFHFGNKPCSCGLAKLRAEIKKVIEQ